MPYFYARHANYRHKICGLGLLERGRWSAAWRRRPWVARSAGTSCGRQRRGRLWQPQVGDSWQWQLQGKIFTVPAETIGRLQAHGGRVLCHFSAGSSDDWRPDFGVFRAADMGNPLDGWPGERWLDIVRAVMSARIRLAAEKGCQGVEPNNLAGFHITADNKLDYNQFLAEAHRAEPAVALKNNVSQVSDLAASFDLAVKEQCHEFDECEAYSAFATLGKPVLNAEYAAAYPTEAAKAALCVQAPVEGQSTLILPLDLNDSFRVACTD